MGRSSRAGNKEEIKKIYSELELASSTDMAFTKPPYRKIKRNIDVYDNDDGYMVYVKNDWYELQKANKLKRLI